MWFFLFLLVFIGVPVLEISLLLRIHASIGLINTVGLVLFTGVAGSILVRSQGLSLLGKIQQRLRSGELPGHELIEGAILLFSGALLITPGVFTDCIGFLGVLPPTRALFRIVLIKHFKGRITVGGTGFTMGTVDPSETADFRTPDPSPGRSTFGFGSSSDPVTESDIVDADFVPQTDPEE